MGSRSFWATVLVGTIIIWLALWLLSRAAPDLFVFTRPFYALLGLLLALAGGALWRRVDPSLLAAASIAIPLAVLWVGNAFLRVPPLVHVAIYTLGMMFFVAMLTSDRLVAWWYRVVLRTSRRPKISR